ncbi:PEP-CTERM sorting domain-containing protein [Chlorobaculum sp. 24CR]|uniref:PEP-CTERM sorting domain-containing protein n=1 Tax=Chlorobaculum sp. 24CR TaxID=2508878 RepID=UPI001430DB45|nr:PEP-CTERM sorting domain-containing protein [Chlorobaculum sp. 24CR]
MKNVSSFLFVFLLACIASKSGYSEPGDVLNIQLGGTTPANYTNGAAINDNTQVWNRLTNVDVTTVNNLQYSGGASTDISVTYDTPVYAGGISTSFKSSSLDFALFRGYMGTNNLYDGYINFSGLPSGTYNVYVYMQGKKTVSISSLQMNVTTPASNEIFSLSNDGKANVLIDGTNWVMKTVIVTDGTLDMAIEKDSLLNGIQIQHISNTVPEPGNVILLGIGGVLVFWFIRLNGSTFNA